MTVTAPSPVITDLLERHGLLVDVEASKAAATADPHHRPTYTYQVEAGSSGAAIDRLFDDLIAVGANPAGIACSARLVTP